MTGPDSPSPDVAIVGLGIIGGSVALRLRERGTRLRGFARDDADARAAGEAGVDVALSLSDAVRGVGLVLVAVPLDALATVAASVVAAAPPQATILHTGSLQRAEVLGLTADLAERVIGTHPMAGSHRVGFTGATPQLFDGAAVYVERRAGARQREDAELFWSMAGAARIEYLDAESHDEAMAWSSHLPQLASTALAIAIAGGGSPLAVPPGPGGRGTTRLAMSSWELWQPILARAPQATLSALDALERTTAALRTALERRDWAALRANWDRARQWRSAIEEEGRA